MACELPTGQTLVFLIIGLIIVEAINLTIIWLLSTYLDNDLLIAIAGYFMHFISFLILYFAVCGFTIGPLVQALLLLGGSIIIALFLVIFLSPSYCMSNGANNTGGGGGLSFFFEIMLLGFFIYSIIFYWHHYVYPFIAQNPPRNNYRFDLIMFVAMVIIWLILFGLNSLSGNSTLSYIENTTGIFAIILFFIKLSVQIRQIISSPTQPLQPPQSINMQGGRWGDEQIISRKTHRQNNVKSAFYNFY